MRTRATHPRSPDVRDEALVEVIGGPGDALTAELKGFSIGCGADEVQPKCRTTTMLRASGLLRRRDYSSLK